MTGPGAAGLRATVTTGTAFGCPFEGEIETGRVADLAAVIAAAGPDEIALADTIGVAVPTDGSERFAALTRILPDGVSTRAHFHNTRPRQTLNWQTPAERLEQLLVATTG